MANAKRCDRCNRFYNSNDDFKPHYKMVSISPKPSNYKRNVDLCQDCRKSWKIGLSTNFVQGLNNLRTIKFEKDNENENK